MITIALGIGKNKNILKAINLFEKKDCNFKLIDNDVDLINEIKNKDTDAVIRGSLPSSNIIKNIKKTYNSNNISRATYIKSDNYEFLLSPVGIDEGNNVNEKLEIAINCGKFLKNLGIIPKIAILANGRKGDYGRSNEINNSINESELLESLIIENSNFQVKNYYILIEKAIKEHNNVIIAPNGIIGNIIFRTLVLLDSWPSYGAITFGLDTIYIDTSRDQSIEGYLRSIKLAYRLTIIK